MAKKTGCEIPKYKLNQNEICEAVKDYLAARGIKFARTRINIDVKLDNDDKIVLHAEVSEIL